MIKEVLVLRIIPSQFHVPSIFFLFLSHTHRIFFVGYIKEKKTLIMKVGLIMKRNLDYKDNSNYKEEKKKIIVNAIPKEEKKKIDSNVYLF